MPNQTRLLVVEDQDRVDSVASKLAERKFEATVVDRDQAADIGLSASGQRIQYQQKVYDQVILAGCVRWTPNFEINKLRLSQTVLALSDLETWQPHSDANQQLLFLNGLFHESHPTVCGRVMGAALKLQTEYGPKGLRTLIFTHNLKVAEDGLEALYQACQKAGVHFVKFTRTRPEFEQNEKGAVTVRFIDEASGQTFYLKPDVTVVDESLTAPTDLSPLANTLRLERDVRSFLQADNVHRLPIGTNHRAVRVADALRGPLTPQEAASDYANAALAPLLDKAETVDPSNAAAINPNHCIRCLTCFRACPHGAVVMAPHPVINAVWCQNCGICVAECPRHAIQMIMADQIRDSVAPSDPTDETPSKRIIVFGCARSAIPSATLARLEGHPPDPPFRLVEIPCAGALSSEHLLKAMAQDVAGVLIVTCHADNCHAGSGNCLAHERVEMVKPVLEQIGVDQRKVAVATVSNNMGAGFTVAVNRFAGQLVNE